MSAAKYPFRFYGREPADWTPSPHGFVYDLQFADALDEGARAAVRAVAERHFARGPAQLGAVWRWSGGRFLALSITERFADAARMVFTHVAEFLSIVHQAWPLRDAVLGNAIGARADRWDAWSIQRAASPDAGPARPDAPWADLLRRPVDASLRWDDEAEAIAPAAAMVAAAAAPKAAKVKAGRAPKYALICVDEAAADDDPAREGWRRVEAHFAGETLVREPGLKVPLGWLRADGRNVALVCLDGAGAPRRIDLPVSDRAQALHVAVDPDGLHAVTHVGQAIYSVDLAQGAARWRVVIHDNNGAVQRVAWVVDDLWAIRCASQLMLFDLSEEDAVFVATQQPQGDLLGSARHGTLLPLRYYQRLVVYGVCDWQIKRLVDVPVGDQTVRVVDDQICVGDGASARRVGVEAAYEDWAGVLRRRAEACRVKRFKPPRKGVRWRWTEAHAMPPDLAKPRRKALTARFGEDARVEVAPGGDALVAVARPGVALSRGGEFWFCPSQGEPRALGEPTAAELGVTNFTMDPPRETLFFITGNQFFVHRAALAGGASERCDVPGFHTRVGILYDIAALGRGDVLALWNNSLDWHREAAGPWVTQATVAVDLPRGMQLDASSRRLAVTLQSRKRLLVYAVGAEGLTELAACADAVKLATFREGRLFAQMVDGQWFELLGADVEVAADGAPRG